MAMSPFTRPDAYCMMISEVGRLFSKCLCRERSKSFSVLHPLGCQSSINLITSRAETVTGIASEQELMHCYLATRGIARLKSWPQKRHLFASTKTISAQSGHFFW